MNIKNAKWIIPLFFILIGVGVMVSTTLPKSTQYYLTVDELLAKEQKIEKDQEFKVAGKVVEGSIEHDQKTAVWNFAVINNGKVINVHFQGAMPDTFKEDAEVVVTGKLESSDKVIASSVLAKCASRYEEKLEPTLESIPRSPDA